MRLLKLGDKNAEVKKLQLKLNLPQDGHFGPQTEKHVIRFQLSNGLTADGIVGSQTWTLLVNIPFKLSEEIDEDNDLSKQHYTTNFNQTIHKYFLPKGEYVKGPIKNHYIFLHHTAGNSNPYACVDMWGRDNRGRIATEFVLGGINHRNGNDEYDGVMVQAFDAGDQAYHLGRTGSGFMNKHSVGLEICNMGYLDSSTMTTYVNSKCQENQITELEEMFKGKMHWHSYSDKQIKETEKWIRYVGERDKIDIRLGLKQFIQKYGVTKGFDFQEQAYYGKIEGLLTHTNVRKDKWDCYPHPDFVDMIMSL
tara:strand:- start:9149 stop:10072 length:924 start_codon:yes stop_codon:yes gene_type:complete